MEILIAVFVHDRVIRPYVGDILVMPVLYCAVRAVWRPISRLLPLYLFLFAAAVEVSQYFSLADRLGLAAHAVLRILLGATFDVRDLLCYAVGAALLFAWQAILRRRAKGKGRCAP